MGDPARSAGSMAQGRYPRGIFAAFMLSQFDRDDAGVTELQSAPAKMMSSF
jgi:hypothetical protein